VSNTQQGNIQTINTPNFPYGTVQTNYPVTQSIYKKMTEVMKEIGPVTKAQTNNAQGFKFRGIDQFVNALHPALVKHGVFMTPECVSEVHEVREVVRSNGKAGVDKYIYLQMKYHFYADDGSKVTVGPVPAEGLDSGDKATNKALSAALKYALIQTFCVPTEDMVEPDADSPTMGQTPPKAGPEKPEEARKPTGTFRRQKAEETVTTPPVTDTTTGPQGTVAESGGWEN